MRVWRGLRWRILLGSILCGMVGLIVAHTLIRRAARETIYANFVPYIRHALENGELTRCERNPEGWSVLLPRGLRVDAYDENTLAPRNPEAPPIDRSLYRRLRAGEPSPLQFARFSGEHAGAMVLRGAPSGPCAILQITFPPRPVSHHRSLSLLLSGTLIVITLATALGFVAVVRPVAGRIVRIRNAAKGVGSPDGYTSGSDTVGDELSDLSNALDQAHERIRSDAFRLEERQAALERYLADIAHDLRTPIASLQVALEQAAGLAPKIDGPLAAASTIRSDLEELLRQAIKDVVYMAGLTDNLRLACRLRDGWDPATSDARVDLSDIVQRVTSRARIFARRRGMSLDASWPDEPSWTRCDPTAAEQVITNLVENAIGYGAAGGHVALLLENTTGGHFCLAVVDDGPGVLPHELLRITERTFRSDAARQRDPAGSGLGLAIAREICARCGYDLQFEPERPRGLRVTMRGATIGPL